MTQEDKKLLLKDLCGRLPYGVKYCRDSWNYEWDQEMSVVEVLEDIDKDRYINYHKVYKVEDIKPYLRPMSSMTEEEDDEYRKMLSYASVNIHCTHYDTVIEENIPDYMDWLNAHHFDYRGLIEKGLALEAPDGMYK